MDTPEAYGNRSLAEPRGGAEEVKAAGVPCASARMTTPLPLRHTECAYYYKRRARVPVLHLLGRVGLDRKASDYDIDPIPPIRPVVYDSTSTIYIVFMQAENWQGYWGARTAHGVREKRYPWLTQIVSRDA